MRICGCSSDVCSSDRRPDNLNAFTAQMTREIIDAFDRSAADDSVRAVIVTGAGRAFSAGADLSGGADTFADFSLQGDETPVRPDGSFDYSKACARDIGGLLTLRIFRSLKPEIGRASCRERVCPSV